MPAPDGLVAAVQHNCHIADARHAGDLPLCIYLLQMRELYRWEQGLPLGAPLRHAEVGEWLDRREALWDGLAAADYAPLPLGDALADPFDAAAVNALLLPQGLVYGAGRLASGRPVFLLGTLRRAEQRGGLQVLVAERELARGLAAPPGAQQGSTVLLRHEALLRWLWERFEAWRLRPGTNAFGAALAACGYTGGQAGDAETAAALDRMADEQVETLLLHELGEHAAGLRLGPGWPGLRLATGRDRHIEPRLRALRDHLADCLVTLPALLERDAAASLHFWMANLEGIRLQWFPGLPVAYAAWRKGDGGDALRRAAEQGSVHFERLAQQALRLHAADGDAAVVAIAALLGAQDAICRD